MDLGAALLALLTGVVVKLAVMCVTAWLLVRIYQSSYRPDRTKKLWLLLPKESLPEVRLLWMPVLLPQGRLPVSRTPRPRSACCHPQQC